MKKKSTLGDRIKLARKSIGLSQGEMSQALQVSDKAISSYEVGRVVPNLETLRKISEVTHRPIVYFLDEGDPVDVEIQTRLKTIERELATIRELMSQQRTPAAK